MNYNLSRSGCTFSINEDDGAITKFASIKCPPDRLREQAFKQLRFQNKRLTNIIVPEVTDITYASFTMDYYTELNIIQLLENRKSLLNYTDTLTNFIDWCMSSSTYCSIHTNILTDKVNAICSNLPIKISKIIQKKYNDFKPSGDLLQLPIGECHGDFTLGNMLFALNRKVILLDFLPSFIETPLNDIVKLRQDTKHMWSLFLANRNGLYAKAMAELDNIIVDKYSRQNYWRHYNLWQFMNLTRILPYCNNGLEREYLLQEIDKI